MIRAVAKKSLTYYEKTEIKRLKSSDGQLLWHRRYSYRYHCQDRRFHSIHHIYGRKDITGEDWGDIFSKAIDGKHLNSPLGIADVVKGKTAWSMKTVKTAHPLTAKKVRLISGRCSPDYSYGIEDPHADIQKTGETVLAIWNIELI